MAEHDCSSCFICRTYEHLKKCWTEPVAELSEPETRWLIHRGLEDAKEHDFISERDVAKFIDLDFALGRDWPDDKRFVAIQALLKDRSTTPEKRMERLYKESQAILTKQGVNDNEVGHRYRIPPTELQREAASRTAARTLKLPPGAIELDDVSADYMWARGSPLFRSVGGGTRLLVGVTTDARSFIFHEAGDIQRSIVELNGFLGAQRVRPLWAIPPKVHCQMLRHFLFGRSGFLASWEFLNGQRSALPQWTMHCQSDGTALFEKCCEEPRSTYAPNHWILDFNYFNTRGGVEKWHASGSESMVHEAEMQVLVPDGKFTYPYG